MDCPSALNKNFWETVHSYPKAEIFSKKNKQTLKQKSLTCFFTFFSWTNLAHPISQTKILVTQNIKISKYSLYFLYYESEISKNILFFYHEIP